TISDKNGATCAFTRIFTVTVNGSSVTVAELADPLPLRERDAVTIGLLRQGEGEGELEARTVQKTREHLEWSATAGEVRAVEGAEGRVIWILPEEPGLYQIELVVRYGLDGRDGVAFNSLAFEVLA